MKKTTLTIIAILVFLIGLKSQIPQNPSNLQSPNAANLGLYGEVPVSLFTGIPEISIPLFTAPGKYNDFSLSLSYYAGGVRPDQHSGWVGTNWSLMAGGCISRIEKGGCDEVISDYYIGYKANPNTLDDNDLTQNNYLIYDTEPDEFIFNFGNYSGKFYFDRSKKLVVKSNKMLKVSLLDGSFTVPNELKKGRPTSWVYTFKGFSIKTEDGTEYIFGGDQSKVEFNMEFWNQLYNQWFATAWHLAKIKYPNGKAIDFNYERGSLINQMYISKSYGNYSLYEKNTNGLSFQTIMCSSTFSTGDASYGFGENRYEGCLISPIYLTSISSPDFRIEFQSGSSYELRVSNSIYNINTNILNKKYFPNGCNTYCNFFPYFGDSNSTPTSDLIQHNLCWSALNTIKIYDGNSKLINSYTFHYDYSSENIYGGDPQYNAHQRLFLMSIDKDNIAKHTFEYYNKNSLPPYLAEKTDHWGFYNNKLANYTNSNNYFASREPDAETMKYGTLNKITYPTGGTTEFEFEANQYSSQTKINRWEGLDYYTSNKIAGGLRIKKITNNPGDGQPPTTKEYFYVKNYLPSNLDSGLSSGILGGRIQYYFENREAKADENLGFGTPGKYVYTCFTTQSVLPVCSNSLGSHIGYSEVVEKLSDGSYTKYKFSNFDTGNLDEKCIATIQTENPYQPYSSKEIERGLLISKEIYDSNNTKKLLMTNHYVNSDQNYINSIKGISTLRQCPGELSGTYYTEATAYKIYTYSRLLDYTTTMYYDENEQPTLTQTTNHAYNKYNQMIKTSTFNSDGKEYVTKVFYPNEIVTGTLPTIQIKDYTSFSNAVISANCLNPVIATENYVNNSLTKGIYNDYTILSNNTPLLNKVYQSNTDNTYRKVYECNDFDTYGNPLFVTLNESVNKVYLWSYNYLYPIAEIQNATYDQVKGIIGTSTIESLATSLTPDMTKVTPLRGVNNTLLNTFTYYPLIGIHTQTDSRGVTTTYEYDTLGRLQYIKDNTGKITQSFDYHYKP